MKNKYLQKQILPLTFLAFVLLSFPAVAEESVEELKAQIKELKQRVEDLESAQNSKGADPFYSQPQRGFDPFEGFDRMQEEINRMFQSPSPRGYHSPGGLLNKGFVNDREIELKENPDSYEIQFDISGLNKEKLDIKINEHSITLSGEYSEGTEESSSHGYFSSRSFGTFLKTIPLPVDADTKKMKTQQKDNLFIIKMPKKS